MRLTCHKPLAPSRAHASSVRTKASHMLASSPARTLALALLVIAAPFAHAADACDAPPEAWQPRSAVRAVADRNGWRVERLKVDDGCYEVKGRDAGGRRFKARLDPVTLQVIAIKRDHGERERHRARDPR